MGSCALQTIKAAPANISGVSKARLVITAVVVEGRPVREVSAAYGLGPHRMRRGLRRRRPVLPVAADRVHREDLALEKHARQLSELQGNAPPWTRGVQTAPAPARVAAVPLVGEPAHDR
jgi:hypothetical protein